jgi:four helix bundle protein
MQDYKKLRVWERAHRLTVEIYKATSSFPKSEIYGLTSQMRSSSSSIPTNIAEGTGRNSQAEFCRFLHISMGSAHEVEYQMLLARDLGFITEEIYTTLNDEVMEIQSMLSTLILKVQGS